MTALLALTSAVFIGSADFLGGLTSRTANGIRVATFVSIVGLPLALVVSVVDGADRVTAHDVAWSVLSGVAVGIGIGFFYTAMGRGLISIVAPVAAVTGAVVPVVYALANGERPGTITLIGLVAAIASVAVVSLAPSEQHAHAAAVNAQVVALAIASGFFFGLFYIAFSRVSDDAGLWPITIERTAASIVLILVALALTRGVATGLRRLLPVVVVIGVLEVAATVPLLLALQRGPVSVASVLASLYPVTTTVLAAAVLGERLGRIQLAGVLLALGAVVLVSLS